MKHYLPQRKHPRLKDYNYSSPGAYYITICAQKRRCLFSRITGGIATPAEIQLTAQGKIAEEQLLLLEERFPTLVLDQYVIMPNHIHAILVLKDSVEAAIRPTINDIVCAYKSLTTRECKKICSVDRVFQTSFYEHVIRGREDYNEIVEYIANNPKQWELDTLHSNQE